MDVCVAGGGSAGFAAAIAAARLGARTLLIERCGVLGGMGSVALVHSICGLYRLPGKGDAPVLANGGFAAEFAARLGAGPPARLGRVDVLLHRPTVFAQVAETLAQAEAPRLDLRLHTELIAADADTATMSCRGATQQIRARTWVDATGDAALAVLRGAACEMAPSNRLQRPAYIFALGGAPAEALDDDGRLRLARHIAMAVREGALPAGALGAHFRASPQPGEAFVTIDLAGGDAYDPMDAACLTGLEIEGRRIGQQLVAFLRARVDALAHCYVAAWPARAGVRESRRIIGRYVIEAEDIASGAQFEDAVAWSAWPMELRETASGPAWRFPDDQRSCGVPLRALRARDDARLFMAGRCLSCSHEAQAALRVMGTCLATGEAAGLAAALVAEHGDASAGDVRGAREGIAR